MLRSMEADEARFHRDVIAGIPTHWVAMPGPTTVCLMFRVGRCDEYIATSGLTHLVEHLALWGLSEERLEFNGLVDLNRCLFMARGDDDAVRAFLVEVTARLQNLPMERVDKEAQVLRAESRSRQVGVPELMLMARYGAAGFGLPWYEEFGLRRKDVSTLAGQWAQYYFSRQNGVVWMTTAPGDLELELPAGHRIPVSMTESIVQELPALAHDPVLGAAMSFECARSAATSIGLAILSRRLRQRLRHEEASIYDILASYTALNHEVAHVHLAAESSPDQSMGVAGAFIQELKRLMEEGPTQEEIAAQVESRRRTLSDHAAIPQWLDYVATNELLGSIHQDPEAVQRETEGVTPHDVAQTLQQAADTLLLDCAEELNDSSIPLTPYRYWPDNFEQRGKTYLPRALGTSMGGIRLLADESGIALTRPLQPASIVKFEPCIAAFRFETDRRGLWAREGDFIHFDAKEWGEGKKLLKLIDRRTQRVAVDMHEDALPRDQLTLKRAGEPSGNLLAGRARRVIARLIDLFPVLAFLLLSYQSFGQISAIAFYLPSLPKEPWALATMLAITLAYDFVGVTVWGKTLGKWLFGLKVVAANGKGRVVWWRSLLRVGVLIASLFIPITLAYQAIWPLVHPERRGLHDLAAGTIVINDRAT